ncbi:MAG: zinc metalloprotease, partial [Bacteroidia bacterium]
MKKSISTLLIAFSCFVNAQITPSQRCGSGILPQQFETWVQSITPVPGKGGSNSTQSVFNIPVIVHVIHDNEPLNSVSATTGGNLNAAQIQDQINIMNRDYNGLNADTASIPAVFKPFLGKFQFNFCLAVVNPTGGVLAEPGIDRINRVSKGWTAPPYTQTYIDGTIKPGSIWNTNQYFNIWVMNLGGGLLGYATFPNPGTSGLSGLSAPYGSTTTDGVVILNKAFGSIGTAVTNAPYDKGRTFVHEAGHWLGLRHIWGDGTCLTDYCNDTPPAQTSNFGCPTFPHNLGTCAGNTTGEMTMNYMDYTDDACM